MKLFLVILFWMFVAVDVCGQSRADKFFERGDYLKALDIYSKQLEDVEDEESEEKEFLKIQVARCNFLLNNVGIAGQVYKTVDTDLLEAEDLANYATTLVHSGDYKKASEQIELAEMLGADPTILERIKNTCDFANEIVKKKPVYAANKTSIDFKGFSSGANYYKGKGIILAAPNLEDNKTKDSRGYGATRLYNTVFLGNGTTAKMLPFADELTDKYHVGAATFTNDFKRIYYTRGILRADKTTIFKLMTAEEIGGKWSNIEELNINSDDYSCVTPYLYKDSLLYFVSDMPGGFGGKDIYVTEVNGSECGEISNLGEQINTLDDEFHPFRQNNGKFYFASRGHIGLGGLDVFVSEMSEIGEWSTPQNMGRPINSSMDDFALVFRNIDCKEGYVSSNRGGTGYMDFLFAIKLLPATKTAQKVLVKVPEPVKEIQKSMQASVVPVPVQQEVDKNKAATVDYRYAIQVGAFRNPVPRVHFQSMKNVKVYLGYDNLYRYAIGEYPEELFAQTDLQHVKRVVHDAFVMNVDKYVAEKKIQNDRKGDNISDDELLLRRLKNFEKAERSLNAIKKLPKPRVLPKPKSNEEPFSEKDYTIVLMSADKVFNPNEFIGINDVDVRAINEQEYMYCAGMFPSIEVALVELDIVKSKGFHKAYILRREGDFFYSESLTSRPVSSHRSSAELKDLLSF